MSTNQRDSLDKALTRPGRVDYQVAFHNATREHARELFELMYATDDGKGGLRAGITEEELKELARKFSGPIENGVFSIAELQGYLLKYKNDPREACQEITKGIEDMLEERAGRKLDSQ